MHQPRLRRPSPALVIAVVALLMAMGGTGYAAFKLPKNSVKAKQIATGAVGSSEVKNKSLKVADISTAAQNALKGQKGDKGDTGAVGPSSATEVFRDSGPADISGSGTTVATLSNLPPGAYAIHAKAEVFGSGTNQLARCQVNAEGDNDFSEATIGAGAGGATSATLPVQVTHTFAGTGTVTLVCLKDGAPTIAVIRSKIEAIHVGSESHSAVTG
jgi:hypothetical protein